MSTCTCTCTCKCTLEYWNLDTIILITRTFYMYMSLPVDIEGMADNFAANSVLIEDSKFTQTRESYVRILLVYHSILLACHSILQYIISKSQCTLSVYY